MGSVLKNLKLGLLVLIPLLTSSLSHATPRQLATTEPYNSGALTLELNLPENYTPPQSVGGPQTGPKRFRRAPNISIAWSQIPKELEGEKSLDLVLDRLRGLNQKIQILTRTSAKAQAKVLQNRLATYGLDSELYVIPDELVERSVEVAAHSAEIQGQKKIAARIRSWWRDVYVKPAAEDITLGSIMGAFRAYTTGSVWLASGVHPAAAVAIVGGQTALTLAWGIGLETFDRIFARARRGKETSATHEFLRRQGFNLALKELWRVLSGPLNSAHSAFSALGQGEIISNVIATGTFGALFSSVRHRKLSQVGSRWANFNVFLTVTPLGIMDIAGFHLMKLVDLGFYQLNLSTVLIAASMAAATATVQWAPNQVEKVAEAQERLFQRFHTRVAQPAWRWIQSRCQKDLDP